jgi:hypothetical protein
MRVTENEKNIVTSAMNTHLLRDIAGATGLKTQDVKPIYDCPEKTENVRKLIDGCRSLLEEDLEELKILLNKD